MTRAVRGLALGVLLTLAGGCTISPAARPISQPITPSAATPQLPQTLTLTLSGDLLWHNTMWFSAAGDHARTGAGDEFDFGPLFAAIRPLIAEADVSLCHEEVPFATPGGPYRNYPLFAAPPQIAAAIADTGWDACTTLSNHSLDDKFEGLVRTLDFLDAAGVAHTGTYRTEAESDRPFLVTARNGLKVAIVAGTYSLNGMPLPEGKEWAVDRLDPTRLLERAKAARAAGADIVLAYVHGGDEYATRPNAQQVRLAELLTASPDIDLVYGSHVHVVQPWTQLNGKWVIYGLGNLVAQHSLENVRGAEGVIARLTWTRGVDGRFVVSKAEYIPTYVSHYSQGPVRLLPVLQALRDPNADTQRLEAAERRTREAVLSLGAAGLVES